MSKHEPIIPTDQLPFFITAPEQGDLLFTAVSVTLVLVILGFGALYFTIQALPDRLAEGTSKTQMQIVGILGLLSLVTMNNAFWIAALLLAAMRMPDFVTPLKAIASSMKYSSAADKAAPVQSDSQGDTEYGDSTDSAGAGRND